MSREQILERKIRDLEESWALTCETVTQLKNMNDTLREANNNLRMNLQAARGELEEVVEQDNQKLRMLERKGPITLLLEKLRK